MTASLTRHKTKEQDSRTACESTSDLSASDDPSLSGVSASDFLSASRTAARISSPTWRAFEEPFCFIIRSRASPCKIWCHDNRWCLIVIWHAPSAWAEMIRMMIKPIFWLSRSVFEVHLWVVIMSQVPLRVWMLTERNQNRKWIPLGKSDSKRDKSQSFLLKVGERMLQIDTRKETSAHLCCACPSRVNNCSSFQRCWSIADTESGALHV